MLYTGKYKLDFLCGVYSTNYWTASAHYNDRVWGVYSFGSFDSFYFDGVNYGLRPVITISKSDI